MPFLAPLAAVAAKALGSSAFISGASGLLGGVLDNRASAKQAAQQNAMNAEAMQRQFQYDKKKMALQFGYDKMAEKRQGHINQLTEEKRFKWLVEGAKNSGFNPLSVLGATGGAMGNAPIAAVQGAAGETAVANQVPLSSLGSAIASAGENFARFMPDPIAQQTQKLRNKLLQKQIAQIDTKNIRMGQPATKVTSSPLRTTDPENVVGAGPDTSARPWPRVDRTKVRTPWGVNAKIPADMARRMNLNRGDFLSISEMADILGESQEFFAAAQIPEIMERLTKQGVVFDHQAPKEETTYPLEHLIPAPMTIGPNDFPIQP